MQTKTRSFEWPAVRPDMKPFRWALDSGGRELICNLVNQHDWRSMVEVGVFCGGSALQWLDACPNIHVYGVDPYPEDADVGGYYAKQRDVYFECVNFCGQSEFEFIAQMSKPDSLFPAVLSNLWDYRDRFTPVRSFSPQALIDIAANGVVPDIIFLDAMKTGEEMPLIRDLWPNCLITGDDWTWQDFDGSNTIRDAVISFAARSGCSVIVKDGTWILEPHDRPIF